MNQAMLRKTYVCVDYDEEEKGEEKNPSCG